MDMISYSEISDPQSLVQEVGVGRKACPFNLTGNIKTERIKLLKEVKNMENKKNKYNDYDDDDEMGVGKPAGYYRMGKVLKDDYDNKKVKGECPFAKNMKKKMEKNRAGPAGYWGI